MPLRSSFAGIVLVMCIAYMMQLSLWLSIIVGAALLHALAEVLLPSSYHMDDEGVSSNALLKIARRRWEDFSGFHSTKEGFFLEGRGKLRWLRQKRSMMLRCPENRAQVEQWLNSRLGQHR